MTTTYEIQSRDGTRLATADTFSAGKTLTDTLPGAYRLVRQPGNVMLAAHRLTEEERAYSGARRAAPAVTLPRTARGVRRGRR